MGLAKRAEYAWDREDCRVHAVGRGGPVGVGVGKRSEYMRLGARKIGNLGRESRGGWESSGGYEQGK